MKNIRVLLAGQPNVGKSSLLNALSGSNITVSNYPGTTVEIFKARKIFRDSVITYEDTPGIYSISDRSEEEKVTEKALFEKSPDIVVFVADAVSIERSLYMALQILESHLPVVLAVNFSGDAEKRGIKINCARLEQILNAPVVPIDPVKRKGLSELNEAILSVKPEKVFHITYDDHIEKAVSLISTEIKESFLPKRFIALRILEEDEDFFKLLKNKEILNDVKKGLADNHPAPAKDISIIRYGTASFIAEKVTEITPLKKGVRILQDNIDNIFLHRFWGQVASGLLMLGFFLMLLHLGKLAQKFLMGSVENLLSSIDTAGKSFFYVVLTQGLTGLAAGVAIALPYVFLFYIILGVLEDSGLLSRLVVNAQRLFEKFNLPAKSFIPLALGLGCTAPAVRAGRILPSKKHQFYTASFFTCVPCSSRIAIIMGVVGFYAGVETAIYVFATLFISSLLWGFIVKKIAHIKKEPIVMELPAYRKPQIKNIFSKSWIRMKDFVYIVIPFLILGGISFGVLDETGVTSAVVKPLSPIAAWLNLPAPAVIPLLFGFLQKDLTGAMLITVFGSKITSVFSSLQMYTFGLASTIGIPCVIAFGMLWREFGFRKTAVLMVCSVVYGLLIAGLAWRIIAIFT
jgi:ferrous iron transport protein B